MHAQRKRWWWQTIGNRKIKIEGEKVKEIEKIEI
jgi:hypothetical protein